jgi:non-specific serine/threonine protein kinase
MSDADWEQKFEFTYKDGKPFLRVLDPNVKRVSGPIETKPAPKVVVESAPLEEIQGSTEATQRLGLVVVETPSKYPGFTVELVSGEFDEDGFEFLGKVEQLDLTKYLNTGVFNEADTSLINSVRKLQFSEIDKYVSRNSPFSGIWENIIYSEEEGLPAETTQLIDEYLHPKLVKIIADHQGKTKFFRLARGKNFTTSNLQAIEVSNSRMSPGLRIKPVKKGIEIVPIVYVDEWDVELSANEWGSHLLVLLNNTLYAWQAKEDLESITEFGKGKDMLVSQPEWPTFLEKQIMPFSRQYRVEFDKALITDPFDGKPEIQLQLQEKNDYLIFSPQFLYQGYPVKFSDKELILIPESGKIRTIKRDLEQEREVLAKLNGLHSNFVKVENSFNLVLKGTEVLKNNWFFLFVDAMKEMNIPVIGFEVLKNYRLIGLMPK